MSQPRARDTIEAMRTMVPPGQSQLGEEARRRLSEATRSLLASHTDPGVEHERFLEIRRRQLCLPADELAAWLRGARVLVTGGTGCIGRRCSRLQAAGASRLVSVSRGRAATWPRWAGVRYETADIRDGAPGRLIRAYQPDLVFHVAAQRDPGRAETEMHRTVSTNVAGTANVLTAAEAAGVPGSSMPPPERRCGHTPRRCTPPPSTPPNSWRGNSQDQGHLFQRSGSPM